MRAAHFYTPFVYSYGWYFYRERSTTNSNELSMTHQVTHNHIRRHRKRSGLSQREIGLLLGYKNQWQISRHERSEAIPPLLAALAYQVIFQVPVSVIFAPMHGTVLKTIEHNLADFERSLTESATRRSGRAIAQKLKWLKDRRK